MSTLFNKQIRCPFCELKFPSRTNYVNKKFEEISSHQDAVEKFMKLGGQEVPLKPSIPGVETRKLRAKLILEEALETIHALGFELSITSLADKGVGYTFIPTLEPDLIGIVDGCCDLRVVTTGTLSACGVKDIRPQELVDDNNLKKFTWTFEQCCELDKSFTCQEVIIDKVAYICVKNSDGKIIKPPGFEKVRLDLELERQLKLNL